MYYLHTKERLKKVSIRGRMALGISCLEILLESEGLIEKEEMKKLLSHLWEFTSSERLDLWEDQMMGYEPEAVFE